MDLNDGIVQGNGGGEESCEDCGLDVWENASVYAEGVQLPAEASRSVMFHACVFTS